jgi:Tfp pilus assembly protein PilN
MEAINLLPAGAIRHKRWGAVADGGSAKRLLVTAAAAAGVATVLFGAAFAQAHSAVSDKQATLDGLEQQVAAAQATAAAAQAARANMQARHTAVTTVTSQRVTWEQVLRDLARVLPANVWLQNLQAQSPTPTVSASTASTTSTTTTAATGSTPTAFVVTGFTSSQKAVARVMDRLSVLPWLSDVSLQQSTRADTGRGGMAVQFTIGANLSSTGGK